MEKKEGKCHQNWTINSFAHSNQKQIELENARAILTKQNIFSTRFEINHNKQQQQKHAGTQFLQKKDSPRRKYRKTTKIRSEIIEEKKRDVTDQTAIPKPHKISSAERQKKKLQHGRRIITKHKNKNRIAKKSRVPSVGWKENNRTRLTQHLNNNPFGPYTQVSHTRKSVGIAPSCPKNTYEQQPISSHQPTMVC